MSTVKVEERRSSENAKNNENSKINKNRRSIAILLTRILFSILLLAGCGRESLPPEEIEVIKLYHYEYGGGEGLFLLTKAPVYSSEYGCGYKYGKKMISLEYSHGAGGKKIENNQGEGYVFQHDLEGQTELLINGKEVWNAANSTATKEVPDYVSELLKRNAELEANGATERVSASYSVSEAEVHIWDSAGVAASWDLDGNLLYTRDDSYLNDPYWKE